jgi:amino acid adenylation domain-containing protein
MQQMNVLEYLEQTVLRVPEKIAFSNGEDSLTFSQVYAHSRGIGSRLAQGGYYNEPVVVFMRKHPKCIPAFFGCVYGGCYYVPIDEEMPRFRIELIFDNLKPRVMLCDSNTAEIAKDFNFDGETLIYDEVAQSASDDAALASIRERQLDTDPIYIVFTSGSTGIPKGVVACHRSVIDYIEQLSDTLGFNGDTVFANQAPLYFDACLKELYPTIKFGATTYLVPHHLFMFPIKLVEYLNEHKVNTVCWVVSALTMISSFKTFDKVLPKYLHTIAFGSEVFPIKQFKLWRAALPEAKFTNLYGPTECTGMSCYFHVDRDFELDEAIPVGRPFKNTQILLLTDKNTLAAAGEVGEICIRGTCLTMGYYRNWEKTNEVFVQNPLNDRFPELIYRTGDLGKWNERGELVFVSRRDAQIKHMGHRIELGEIEAAAASAEGVRAACCVYDAGNKRIGLYYVGEIEPAALTKTLRAALPPYMIPAFCEKLSAMPLTPNGKVDRKGLRERAENREA